MLKRQPPFTTQDCTHCLAGNEPTRHFCRQCGTPLTSYAATDPLGQIYAQGDLYRKAIETPTKPFVLIGMWLLCGPTAVGASGFFPWFIWEVAANPRAGRESHLHTIAHARYRWRLRCHLRHLAVSADSQLLAAAQTAARPERRPRKGRGRTKLSVKVLRPPVR
jgi:hypothetical protein